MTALLHKSNFCPYEALRSFANRHNANNSQHGALASFCGIARSNSESRQQGDGSEKQNNEPVSLVSLHLDCYPAMAILCMQEIIAEAHKRWALIDATIQHRVGEIPVGETIVLVASLSKKRNNAFEACRYMTDMVKVRPPFWKCEMAASGQKKWLTTAEQDLQRATDWHEKSE